MVKESTVLDEALDDKLEEKCKRLEEKVNKYRNMIEPLTKKKADLQYQLDNFEETRAERNTLDKKIVSMGEKIKETMDKEMDLGQVKDEVDRDER